MGVLKELVITEGATDALDKIYSRMISDFPPEELKSKEQFEQLMANGQYKLYLARHAASSTEGAAGPVTTSTALEADTPGAKHTTVSRIVGYAFMYEPESPRIAWLDYFAIVPQRRGTGFGTQFVDMLSARMRSTRIGIMLEAEPATSSDGQTLENQRRRIQFYTRLGAKQLDVDYLFPMDAAPYPMLLFFRPITTMRVLPKELIQEMIQAAYSYIHRDVQNRDAILQSFIGTAHDSHL